MVVRLSICAATPVLVRAALNSVKSGWAARMAVMLWLEAP
uniref:Uncharacterized protein n=1 Tax=Arundo donax TaxID=35708 RepID=A0A0A9C7S2_ARUDO